MISTDLLSLLRCPISGQPLATADQTLLDRLEASRIAGALKNRSGESVTHPLVDGLIREDKRLFYPIVDDLPVLLPEEAIEISGDI
ncbi:MAG: hypothetical protein ABI680_08640 [Chthoniobacteraceae bacterium]